MEKETKKMPDRYIDDRGYFCIVPIQQSGFKETVETYIEIPPYAVDKESGEVLNKTAKRILKRGEDFNFYEKIQSYRDECDVYSVLAKYAMTGDPTLLNKRVGTFSDIFDLPDNINDFTNLTEKQKKKLNQYSLAEQKIILNGTSAEVSNLVQDLVKKELVKKGVIQEESEEVKHE